MIDYETFHFIKKLHKSDHSVIQISEISGVSENTVRRALSKERYVPRKVAPTAGKLDPYKGFINEKLAYYADYTATQMLRFIKERGYDGGFTILKEYLRKIRPKALKAYLKCHFPPGDCAQVDWGVAGYIMVGKKLRKVNFFVMVLGHSRAIFVVFYLGESQEFWHEAHRLAFEHFGGVPKRCLVDNCKTAILSNNGKGEVVVNPHYLDFANHYGFEIVPCGVRKPHEKGRVENGVKYVKSSFLNGRKLEPFQALNYEVNNWRDTVADKRIHGTTRKVPAEELIEELKVLQDLPAPYECVQKRQIRANKFYRINYDSNSYTVPHRFAGKQLIMKAGTETIKLYHEGTLIAEHQRCFDCGCDIHEPSHTMGLLKERPNAEANTLKAIFLKICPDAAKYLQGLDAKAASTTMALRKILMLRDMYGQDEIVIAIKYALEYQLFSSAYLENILSTRKNLLPEASPIQLSVKSDVLKLSIQEPDLAIYQDFQ